MGFGVTESTLRKKSIIGNRVATVNAAALLHPCFYFSPAFLPSGYSGLAVGLSKNGAGTEIGEAGILGRYILRSSTCHSWRKFVSRPSSFHQIGNFMSWHVSSRTDSGTDICKISIFFI